MIEDRCSFLREPISIYYDKNTLQPTSYIGTNSSKYTPDFLVRKWKDNSAYLIEIKANECRNSEDLNKCKTVAENYLNKMKLDWQYKVIFDSDIVLTSQKLEKFKVLKSKARTFKSKMSFLKMDKKYNLSDRLNFSCTPIIVNSEVTKDEYVRYVKYGKTE